MIIPKNLIKITNKLILVINLAVIYLSILTALPVNANTNLDLGLEFGAYTGLGSGDIRTLIARIINVGLGFLGIVSVIIVLFGGFMYMTSGGEQDKTKKARSVITAGVIGLIIILSAYALSKFILEQLQQATTATD